MNYKKEVDDILVQYGILRDKFKEIYPIYKLDNKNPEIQNMYENIRGQIQNIFSELETIRLEVSNKNSKIKDDVEKIDREFKESKNFYMENKPKLQGIIDANLSAVPREVKIQKSLNNKYIDIFYSLTLFGVLGYSFYKLR